MKKTLLVMLILSLSIGITGCGFKTTKTSKLDKIRQEVEEQFQKEQQEKNEAKLKQQEKEAAERTAIEAKRREEELRQEQERIKAEEEAYAKEMKKAEEERKKGFFNETAGVRVYLHSGFVTRTGTSQHPLYPSSTVTWSYYDKPGMSYELRMYNTNSYDVNIEIDPQIIVNGYNPKYGRSVGRNNTTNYGAIPFEIKAGKEMIIEIGYDSNVFESLKLNVDLVEDFQFKYRVKHIELIRGVPNEFYNDSSLMYINRDHFKILQ